MISLRFHKNLYSIDAVEAAVAAFDSFASFGRSDESDHLIVELSIMQPDLDEPTLAGEFANYVLGATVDSVPSPGKPS
jgi:hypothetical protein